MPREKVPTLKKGVTTIRKNSTASVVKLHHWINRTKDADVPDMADDDYQDAYDHWHELNGDDPPPEVEPAREQLTALKAVVDDGEPPVVDLAIWGNAAYMATKKPRMRGLRPVGDGVWAPVEMSGPTSFNMWLACFLVFRTAAIMLRMITPAALDSYIAQIQLWHNLYGQKCWHIIAHADQIARERFWERARRQCARRHRAARNKTDFEEDAPWTHALYELLNNQRYWNDNLTIPCTLVAAYSAAHTKVVQDVAGVIDIAAPHSAVGPSASDDLSEKGHDGHYLKSKKGLTLCDGFRRGTCKRTVNGRCAEHPDCVHQCSLCLRNDHGGDDHARRVADGKKRGAGAPPPPPPPGGRGNGGGRGGGKRRRGGGRA